MSTLNTSIHMLRAQAECETHVHQSEFSGKKKILKTCIKQPAAFLLTLTPVSLQVFLVL